ncbi:hypothetical protein U9M48_044941 [Paspalum notatum var. saurae]|uniref:Uncharacterized protein n=1 Tax=Paspalum notatum var. saurae TaxID=547442 RepID=A0AAQ3UWA3_PASNO
MAVSSISCSLRPPAPVAREASARLQPPPRETATPWSSGGLRRACVAAAAACVVIGAAGGGVAAAAASTPPAHGAVAVDAAAAPRWSDRRECPPWRANSLENIVPENLPRPSARRRFNSIKTPKRGPAVGPQAVAPFLALRPGMDDCFSL